MLPTGSLICCTVPSEAVPFVYLASVCLSLQCLISALTQAGGGGLLFRFACSVALRGGRGAALPVYTAQAPGRSIWSGPCAARGSSFPVFHKSARSVLPAFCAFPGPSSSGRQCLDSRTRPRCGAPSSLHGPSLNFRPRLVFSLDPPSRCRPSRISGSL